MTMDSSPRVPPSFDPNAVCFGGAYPASGVPAYVAVVGDELVITILPPDVARQVTLPFDRLSVEAGGFDHDQLVLHWDEDSSTRYTLYVKAPEVIATLRRSARAGFADRLQATTDAVRRHRTQRRTVWMVTIGAVLGAVVLLWAGSDLLTELAVARVPISWEESLGEAANRQFLAGHTVVRDGPAVEAVEQIRARLVGAVQASPYTFRVAVVDSGDVNAFALPGGYIVVFTGLLKKAQSPEEVAGVLGHELNHVLKRHAVGRVVRSLGLVAALTILTGNQQGWAGIVRELGVELATLKFGRAQETEADLEGLRLLQRAHIDPQGLVTFFERLGAETGAQIEILSSHPVSEGRAARLKEEIAALPPTTVDPFPFAWPIVQAALK